MCASISIIFSIKNLCMITNVRQINLLILDNYSGFLSFHQVRVIESHECMLFRIPSLAIRRNIF